MIELSNATGWQLTSCVRVPSASKLMSPQSGTSAACTLYCDIGAPLKSTTSILMLAFSTSIESILGFEGAAGVTGARVLHVCFMYDILDTVFSYKMLLLAMV